jgi:hypothetical protein
MQPPAPHAWYPCVGTGTICNLTFTTFGHRLHLFVFLICCTIDLGWMHFANYSDNRNSVVHMSKLAYNLRTINVTITRETLMGPLAAKEVWSACMYAEGTQPLCQRKLKLGATHSLHLPLPLPLPPLSAPPPSLSLSLMS